MHRVFFWILALGFLTTHVLSARDLSGQWQGTLPVQGGLRMILRVTQAEDGKLSATFSSIDQSTEEVPVTAVSLEGNTFKFSFEQSADRYEGTLNEDGMSIAGRWYSARHPGSSYPIDWRLATGADKWAQDSSPHKVEFVPVDQDVKLEVLDWGGQGRALVFLAGLGNDAHVFDKFAPKFTSTYHVYGITRRGYGASSKPEPNGANYSADRLGDDVLTVIDALKLDRPVLVGHSIAGEELSSIGSRHPERVAGLIYLDAGYEHAFYDRAHGDLVLDVHEVQKKLARLNSLQTTPRDSKALIQELLSADLPQLQKALEARQQILDAKPDEDALARAAAARPDAKFVQAVMIDGRQKYTAIPCPVLAIYAVEPPLDPTKPDVLASTAAERAASAAQASAFEAGVPTARVVRIQNAEHYVFLSNEEEVLRAMTDFLAKLP